MLNGTYQWYRPDGRALDGTRSRGSSRGSSSGGSSSTRGGPLAPPKPSGRAQTTTDILTDRLGGPAMLIDIFSELQRATDRGPGSTRRQVIDDALVQARLADSLGYDCWWSVEHHGAVEFSLCSTPELLNLLVATVHDPHADRALGRALPLHHQPSDPCRRAHVLPGHRQRRAPRGRPGPVGRGGVGHLRRRRRRDPGPDARAVPHAPPDVERREVLVGQRPHPHPGPQHRAQAGAAAPPPHVADLHQRRGVPHGRRVRARGARGDPAHARSRTSRRAAPGLPRRSRECTEPAGDTVNEQFGIFTFVHCAASPGRRRSAAGRPRACSGT